MAQVWRFGSAQRVQGTAGDLTPGAGGGREEGPPPPPSPAHPGALVPSCVQAASPSALRQ